MMTKVIYTACLAISLIHVFIVSPAQEMITVRPRESDEVFVNPGIGFMTFQRFNGDTLNTGEKWTEGFPIEYQSFDGDLNNRGYPNTSLAYFRIYWKFIEPEKGRYRRDLIDDDVIIPDDQPPGIYDLSLGILDRAGQVPKVKLAIENADGNGWYPLGKINVLKK
jgi:hypothetical protein